jgi:predicted ABC-type transport system involved in lysophospholipase L1 biosynthesis ATPase subunit
MSNQVMPKNVLSARGVSKVYGDGAQAIAVLGGVEIDVAAGEFIAIVGASGTGKSTLLHVLGGLDDPDNGEVVLKGKSLSKAYCHATAYPAYAFGASPSRCRRYFRQSRAC